MDIAINNYNSFKNWYLKILDEFNFSQKEDKLARDILLKILGEKSSKWNAERILENFIHKITEKSSILIFGCGPTLVDSVEKIIENKDKTIFETFINLAADGASVFLRENGLPIDGIFTDLDGITKREFTYGKYDIIHAHGDNIEKLKIFKNEIIEKKNIISTCQVKPENGVFNPGGFTDGDRILYFIKDLINPYQKLYLIGMDFKDIIGKYSKPNRPTDFVAPQMKRKKLKFAVALIEEISGKMTNELYFVNSSPVSEKFKYLSLAEFLTDHI